VLSICPLLPSADGSVYVTEPAAAAATKPTLPELEPLTCSVLVEVVPVVVKFPEPEKLFELKEYVAGGTTEQFVVPGVQFGVSVSEKSYLLVGGTAKTKSVAENIPAKTRPKSNPLNIGKICFLNFLFGGSGSIIFWGLGHSLIPLNFILQIISFVY